MPTGAFGELVHQMDVVTAPSHMHTGNFAMAEREALLTGHHQQRGVVPRAAPTGLADATAVLQWEALRMPFATPPTGEVQDLLRRGRQWHQGEEFVDVKHVGHGVGDGVLKCQHAMGVDGERALPVQSGHFVAGPNSQHARTGVAAGQAHVGVGVGVGEVGDHRAPGPAR